ncbi:MAG: hypothetical protein ACKVX7_18510 [Planctomycetota bacterium]
MSDQESWLLIANCAACGEPLISKSAHVAPGSDTIIFTIAKSEHTCRSNRPDVEVVLLRRFDGHRYSREEDVTQSNE